MVDDLFPLAHPPDAKHNLRGGRRKTVTAGSEEAKNEFIPDKSEYPTQVAEDRQTGFESYCSTGLQSLVLESWRTPNRTIKRLKLHQPDVLDVVEENLPDDTKIRDPLTQDSCGGNSLMNEAMISSPNKLTQDGCDGTVFDVNAFCVDQKLKLLV